MDDGGFGGYGQRLADGADDLDNLVYAELVRGHPHNVFEVFTLDVFHCEIWNAFSLTKCVNLNNIWMYKRSGGTRLALEAVDKVCVLASSGQNFKGNPA